MINFIFRFGFVANSLSPKIKLSSVSLSSEQIEELWVVVVYMLSLIHI